MVDNLITATSLREAVKNKDNRSAYLAGGTEINRLGSTVKARNLISIGRIKDLDGITKGADAVRIGAMCTFQDIIESKSRIELHERIKGAHLLIRVDRNTLREDVCDCKLTTPSVELGPVYGQ